MLFCPVICWWTCGLIPYIGCCTQHYSECESEGISWYADIISFPSDQYPEMGYLGHVVDLFLVLVKAAWRTLLTCIPNNSVCTFHFLWPSWQFYLYPLMIAILIGVIWGPVYFWYEFPWWLLTWIISSYIGHLCLFWEVCAEPFLKLDCWFFFFCMFPIYSGYVICQRHCLDIFPPILPFILCYLLCRIFFIIDNNPVCFCLLPVLFLHHPHALESYHKSHLLY